MCFLFREAGLSPGNVQGASCKCGSRVNHVMSFGLSLLFFRLLNKKDGRSIAERKDDITI